MNEEQESWILAWLLVSVGPGFLLISAMITGGWLIYDWGFDMMLQGFIISVGLSVTWFIWGSLAMIITILIKPESKANLEGANNER